MAASTLPIVDLVNFNTFYTDESAVALNSSDGGLLTPTKKDGKLLIKLVNSESAQTPTVTIYAGNGLQGVANLTKTFANSQVCFIQIETGKFLNVTGTNKGKILIGDATGYVDVVAYELP